MSLDIFWASLVVLKAKNLSAVQEIRVRSRSQDDSVEKGMATHSSIFAWRIPWAEEPGGLQSMGSQELGTTHHHYVGLLGAAAICVLPGQRAQRLAPACGYYGSNSLPPPELLQAVSHCLGAITGKDALMMVWPSPGAPP